MVASFIKFGIKLRNVSKVVLFKNLVIGVDKPIWYKAEYTELFVTYGIYYEGTQHLEQAEVVLDQNRVSSVSFFGFHVPGNACGFSETLNFRWNEAHSCKAGWFGLQLSNEKC